MNNIDELATETKLTGIENLAAKEQQEICKLANVLFDCSNSTQKRIFALHDLKDYKKMPTEVIDYLHNLSTCGWFKLAFVYDGNSSLQTAARNTYNHFTRPIVEEQPVTVMQTEKAAN